MKEHWDKAYSGKKPGELGWYEATPEPGIRLFGKCAIEKDAGILDVGAGASSFVDYLLGAGFGNVIAADISAVALEKLRERIGDKALHARYIVDDVTRPVELLELKGIALWHDRAMLHFLVDEGPRGAYLATLKSVLAPGGYVIIGVFSLDGEKKCSGLDVRNYSAETLSHFLGGDFRLLESFGHTHHTPSGAPRPYVYALFQRR